MVYKRSVKFICWCCSIFITLLLLWSLFNYKLLENNVTTFVQTGGLIALVIIVIILEGAPILIGGSIAVAALLLMKINPLLILALFLISATIGNILYYYLGYFSGEKILKYFDKKDVVKYDKLFKKYGRLAMIIMAISPVPYLPTLAGYFKMSPLYMFTETLGTRLIRHTIVFFFWYTILV